MQKALLKLLDSPAAALCWRTLMALLIAVICFLALSPNPPRTVDTGWDKSNHMLAFAVLAFCGHWSWSSRLERYLALPAGLLVLGGVIELLQLQVPGRSGEWVDLLADGCGIALGLGAAALLMRLLRTKA